MRRVAITGGIAEGKSTVIGYLRSLGRSTASADDVARGLFEQQETQAAIAAMLGAPAPVSRDALRRAIAAKPELRRKLNGIMHPRLLARLLEARAEFSEVPLLIETCTQGLFDEVWVVTCGPEEQFRRLEKRLGKLEATQLLATQMPTSAKLPFADLIVRTNQPESSVLAHVRRHAL